MREFAKLGLTKSVGGVLALALSRELTPVVTCIILAGASMCPCSICVHTASRYPRGTTWGCVRGCVTGALPIKSQKCNGWWPTAGVPTVQAVWAAPLHQSRAQRR